MVFSARDLEADAARDLDAARNLEADPDARAGRGPQRSPDQRFRVLPSGALAFRLPDTKDGKQVCLDVVRATPASAGRFIFFSSRPLQGAQYGGALRHCTLTPLHPCRPV